MSSSLSALQVSILNEIPTSPQVIQTLRNLQKITQINVDTPDFKSSLKDFSEQHLLLYKSHSTQEGITHHMCFLPEQRDGDLYIHQLTGEVVRVEPLEGLVLERNASDKAHLDQKNLDLMNNIYQKLHVYLNRHFSGSFALTCHFKTNKAKLNEIIIGLTNKNINHTNFSSSQWTSCWSFKQTEYSTKITSRNHFYQGGNIIFQRPKSVHTVLAPQKSLPISNLSYEAVDRIVNIIESEEKSYQKQLQIIYAQKLSQSLKKLRRISPLTQGKMIWNVNAVLLSEGLNQKLPSLA